MSGPGAEHGGQTERSGARVRPVLLDLFCGAGGAAMGYHRAGFDVVGVDMEPQPHYPFEFHQGDALEYLLTWAGAGHYDAIHASPVCKDHSRLAAMWGKKGSGQLLTLTRGLLTRLSDVPWVIENVPGAPMRADYKLCGCQFALPRLRRERWFETSWHGFEVRQPCSHPERSITVSGHPGGTSTRDGSEGFGSKADWERAMGIDWMTARELAQAIPPAYTEHIGAALLAELRSGVAA